MKFSKITIMVLALMLIFSVSGGALALEEVSTNEFSAECIKVGEAIGMPADQDGILIDDPSTITRGLPFTMTATSVSNLLTTYSASGKNFTGGAMDAFAKEGLKITGKVTSSLGTSSGYDVKCGACYYNSSNDTFYSVAYDYFPSGKNYTYWAEKLCFSNSVTYYGHITNNLGSGTVSGSLTFSVSTKP